MNLYLLSQNENNGYDTYDSMVIAAENETDARYLSFVEAGIIKKEKHWSGSDDKLVWRDYYLYEKVYFSDWAEHPTIALIATNTTALEGVVCASFNAG